MSVSLTQNIQQRSSVYQIKNEADKLSANRHNVTSNTVCAVASNLLPIQKFEHEIWHKKKRRKIVLTWKRRPEFCL